jgi:hypothetical protein
MRLLSAHLALATGLIGAAVGCGPGLVFAPFPETRGRAALWLEPGDVVPRVTAIALEPARPTLERELDDTTPHAELWILDEALDTLGLWPGVIDVGFDATGGDPPPPVAARFRASEAGLEPIPASAFPPFRLAAPRCGALALDVVPIERLDGALTVARALGPERVVFHSSTDDVGVVRFLEVTRDAARGFDSTELGAPELPSAASTLTPLGELVFVGREGGLLTWTATGGLARRAPPAPRDNPRTKFLAATSSITARGLRVYALDDDARVWQREPGARAWVDLALPAMEDALCAIAKLNLEGRGTLEIGPDGMLWVLVRSSLLWRWDGVRWTDQRFVLPRDGLSVGCGGNVLHRPGRSSIALARRSLDTVVLEQVGGEWDEAFVDAELDGRTAFIADGTPLIGHIREPAEGLISGLVQRGYAGAQLHRCRLADVLGMAPRAGAPLGDGMVMAGFAFPGEPNRLLRLRWTTRPEAR